jgi:hypothetical protein
MKPYFDISDQVRLFSQEIDESELMWHRDEEDREIISILKTDWKIQLENELPTDLNSSVKIKAGEWHRLIKGNGNLEIKIVKNILKNERFKI